MLTTPSVQSGQACVCSHWPLDGETHIQAAALALRGLSKAWDAAQDLLEGEASVGHACLDVAVTPLDDVQFDMLLFQAALVPDSVQAIVLALSKLERDYRSVKEWLVISARDACLAKDGTDTSEGVGLIVVRDDHRVVARDWLAADMNAMIAWLLRRAIRVLMGMDLAPEAVRVDFLGARHYPLAFQAVAAILDRAVQLALEGAAYVEGFNHQWLALRAHVAIAKTLCPLKETAFAVRNAAGDRDKAPRAVTA